MPVSHQKASACVAVRQRHYAVRASSPSEDLKEKVSETGEVFKSNVAQLLGVRGGERTSDIWKIRLQLTKPVTWVPLIWGKRLKVLTASARKPQAQARH